MRAAQAFINFQRTASDDDKAQAEKLVAKIESDRLQRGDLLLERAISVFEGRDGLEAIDDFAYAGNAEGVSLVYLLMPPEQDRMTRLLFALGKIRDGIEHSGGYTAEHLKLLSHFTRVSRQHNGKVDLVLPNGRNGLFVPGAIYPHLLLALFRSWKKAVVVSYDDSGDMCADITPAAECYDFISILLEYGLVYGPHPDRLPIREDYQSCMMSTMTRMQIVKKRRVWQDPIELWEKIVNILPSSNHVTFNVALRLAETGLPPNYLLSKNIAIASSWILGIMPEECKFKVRHPEIFKWPYKWTSAEQLAHMEDVFCADFIGPESMTLAAQVAQFRAYNAWTFNSNVFPLAASYYAQSLEIALESGVSPDAVSASMDYFDVDEETIKVALSTGCYGGDNWKSLRLWQMEMGGDDSMRLRVSQSFLRTLMTEGERQFQKQIKLQEQRQLPMPLRSGVAARSPGRVYCDMLFAQSFNEFFENLQRNCRWPRVEDEGRDLSGREIIAAGFSGDLLCRVAS